MPPASKRRKLVPGQVEDLTFDPAARQEYLSGFHKRKQARIQHARDQAVKRDREEKVKERRQLREQRKEELQQHVDAVNAELKKQKRHMHGDSEENSSEDDDADDDDLQDDQTTQEARGWSGISDDGSKPPEPLEQEEEYVDEDRYTTVTVEPMGDPGASSEEDEEFVTKPAGEEKASDKSAPGVKRPSWAKGKSSNSSSAQPKAKKKKFRYESKGERALTRQKQKSKNRIAKARRQGT